MLTIPQSFSSLRNRTEVITDKLNRDGSAANYKKLHLTNLFTNETVVLTAEPIWNDEHIHFDISAILKVWVSKFIPSPAFPSTYWGEFREYSSPSDSEYTCRSHYDSRQGVPVSMVIYDANNELQESNTAYYVNALTLPYEEQPDKEILCMGSVLNYYQGLPLTMSVRQIAGYSLPCIEINGTILGENAYPDNGTAIRNIDIQGAAGDYWYTVNRRQEISVINYGSSSITVRCQPTPRNPLYLRWLNPYGGLEHVLLAYHHEITDVFDKPQAFTPSRYSSTDAQFLSRKVKRTVRGGLDNIDIDEFTRLRTLLRAPLVQVFLMPGLTDQITGEHSSVNINGEWVTILLDDNTLLSAPDKHRYNFEISFLLFEEII